MMETLVVKRLTCSARNLSLFLIAFKLPRSDYQLKTSEISPIKLFGNNFEPFLFKWSLPLLRCWGLNPFLVVNFK